MVNAGTGLELVGPLKKGLNFVTQTLFERIDWMAVSKKMGAGKIAHERSSYQMQNKTSSCEP